MIFDFLRKLFGWADDTSRKRRAVSFSTDSEFVTPKKRCYDYKSINVDNKPIEINDDSDSDGIEMVVQHKHSAVKSSSRLNGTCNDKPFTCCSSPYFTPKSQQCYGKSNKNDILFENKTQKRSPMNGSQQRCYTLNKTHRLKEKTQYKELLQNFRPDRIHVICDKYEENKAPVEIIDLEKSDCLNVPLNVNRKSSPKQPITSKMHWRNTLSKEKQSREKISKEAAVITIDVDEKNESEHSICNKKQQSSNKYSTIAEKSTPNKYVECVATNSLRDQLAAKAVIREDFVPQISKRYNDRFEQRYKEAEELKKMTCVLSKHNRLKREAALEEHLARSLRLCEAVIDEREEQEEPSLPTLTEDMIKDIRNALIPRPPDEILVEGFGLRITRKDIHTLADLNWLNDEVINFYMNLLIARSASEKYPKVYAMNTFFYPKLISGGHASLKRWTRKIDIFAQDLIVVPIHLDVHWCMSVIDFRDKSIRYYDSMGGNNLKCLSALKQYLEYESLDKKKQAYDTSNWKLECAKNIPQQMNGSDCGVFSCMFAEYISANRKISFTQQDMPYFRNKMVYEILKSKLL